MSKAIKVLLQSSSTQLPLACPLRSPVLHLQTPLQLLGAVMLVLLVRKINTDCSCPQCGTTQHAGLPWVRVGLLESWGGEWNLEEEWQKRMLAARCPGPGLKMGLLCPCCSYRLTLWGMQSSHFCFLRVQGIPVNISYKNMQMCCWVA